MEILNTWRNVNVVLKRIILIVLILISVYFGWFSYKVEYDLWNTHFHHKEIRPLYVVLGAVIAPISYVSLLAVVLWVYSGIVKDKK